MGDLISPWKPEPDVVIHQALGKACEEASELANILARCLIQGINSSEPVTGKPNLQALFEEIADLDAAVQWLREVLDNGYDQYDGARADRKLAGFHRWQRLLEEDMAAPAPAPNLVVTDELATTYKAAFRAVFDRWLNDEAGIPQENIGLIATKAGLQAVFDALTSEGQPDGR